MPPHMCGAVQVMPYALSCRQVLRLKRLLSFFFFCYNVLPPEATAFSLQKKNRCKPFEMHVPQISDTFSNCDTLADQKNRSTIPPDFFDDAVECYAAAAASTWETHNESSRAQSRPNI
jgi:hypothetical protein